MVFAVVASIALWVHCKALPEQSLAQVGRERLPNTRCAGPHCFGRARQAQTGTPLKSPKIATAHVESRGKGILTCHGHPYCRAGLPTSRTASAQIKAFGTVRKDALETVSNATRFDYLVGAVAMVLKQVRRFLQKITAQRLGGLSRALNIIIVVAGVFHAVWSWLTTTPQFVSVLTALLHSRPFLRLQAAWIALPAQNWAAFENYIMMKPWTSASVITGIAYALADWTAQSCEGRGPFGFSRTRLVRNMVVGAGLLAPYAHQYYTIQDMLIPGKGLAWAPLKVFLDQTIYAASYNCLFLGGLGLLQQIKPKEVVDDIKEKLPVMMKGSWRFWPFVHCLTYTVIPTQFKLLWVDAVDVIWVTYLSMIANSRRAETLEVVQELVEKQASGKFVEGWLSGRALSTLAERCAELTMYGPELPPESERVAVTDDPGRNLTIVQIAEADRNGLMLEIMLSLRRQNVAVVHGIIDVTDASLSANVFFVREDRSKLPLSKERREVLKRVLEQQLYSKFPAYSIEAVTASTSGSSAAPMDSVETETLVPASKKLSAPPHAATELLYAIELDKQTRIEVGQALQKQGLQVPDDWIGEEAEEEEEEDPVVEQQIGEAVAEQNGINITDAEEAPMSILTMAVNDTDIAASLANIIQEAVNTDPPDESLSESTTPAAVPAEFQGKLVDSLVDTLLA